MIANNIIKSALRKLVVIPSGGTPTTAQYADGLELLNDIIASWSAEASLVYQDTLEEITIASGTQSFTIGNSGAEDYTSNKPTEVLSALLKDSNGSEYNLRTADVNIYDNLGDKTTVGLPGWLYFRNTHPDATFYFDNVTDKAYTLVLTSMKELSQFVDGTTDLSLPAYYEKALKDTLTIEIAPEMGAAKRVTPAMLAAADSSMMKVVGKAVKINVSTTELGGRGAYNINGDTY